MVGRAWLGVTIARTRSLISAPSCRVSCLRIAKYGPHTPRVDDGILPLPLMVRSVQGIENPTGTMRCGSAVVGGVLRGRWRVGAGVVEKEWRGSGGVVGAHALGDGFGFGSRMRVQGDDARSGQ